jgi:ubiquinone/menaquinone biosynthesis C-methylase UbiE
MFSFFRKPAGDPLAVTMTGVKLGDHVLAVGANDVKLIAALAIKAGLTGRAVVVDADEEKLLLAASKIEAEGALVEITRAPWGLWPFDSDSFDVVVIPDLLMTLNEDARSRVAGEVFRALRPGGRAIVIESAPRGGFGGIVQRRSVDPSRIDGASAALKSQGFSGVRLLAERDGTAFIEGARRA